MSDDADVLRFEADLAAFAKRVDEDLSSVRKKVAFAVFKGVVDRTPVDTGRARLGWAMTDGSPSTFVPPKQEKGSSPKPGPTPESQAATFSDPYGVTWIANNTPYIAVLEYGRKVKTEDGERVVFPWSKKAPDGMVVVTLADVEARFS